MWLQFTSLSKTFVSFNLSYVNAGDRIIHAARTFQIKLPENRPLSLNWSNRILITQSSEKVTEPKLDGVN